MIRLMDMGYIFTLMGLNMKVIGKTINKMVTESSNGRMAVFMRVFIRMGRNMVTGSMYGQTVRNIMVRGVIMQLMVRVFTVG